MTIKIEIDGVETKSALIKEILEQDTLEKVAYKIAELQCNITRFYSPIHDVILFGDSDDKYGGKLKKRLWQIKKNIFGNEAVPGHDLNPTEITASKGTNSTSIVGGFEQCHTSAVLSKIPYSP